MYMTGGCHQLIDRSAKTIQTQRAASKTHKHDKHLFFLRVIPTKLSDIYSDILSGIRAGIYSDILSDIYVGVLPGMLSAISSDIIPGIRADIYSDILSGILSGSFSGICAGTWSSPQGIIGFRSVCAQAAVELAMGFWHLL